MQGRKSHPKRSDSHNKESRDILSIEPAELVFQRTKVGQVYEMEINIRNKTAGLHKLKIYGPKYSAFELINNPQADSLSSGLSKKVKILYRCKDTQDYYDAIKIACITENLSIEVPLRAYSEKISVSYEEIFEAGTICLNAKHVIVNNFVNKGEACRVKIIKDNFENIFINPDEFIMKEGQIVAVEMAIIPSNPGVLKNRLLVEVNGNIGNPINIIYSALEFKFYLTNEDDRKISELDFGQAYFGEKKTVKVFAVNNTPERVKAKSKIRLGWKFNESALQSPQELGIECSSTIIDVEPKECKIEPFSKRLLSLTCLHEVTREVETKVANFAKREEIGPNKLLDPTSPELLQKYKINMFESHETLIAEFEDKKIYCSLKATCVHPLVKVQPSSLFFGDLPLKSTCLRTIAVSNLRENLPVKIVFPKAFSFEIIPSSAVIMPNGEEKFEIFLTPVSIGNFNHNITCIVANEFKVDLSVFYKSVSLVSKSHKSLYHSSKEDNQLNISDITNLNNLLNKFNEKKKNKSEKNIFSRTKNRRMQAISHSIATNASQIDNPTDAIVTLKNPHLPQTINEGDEKLINGNKLCSLPKTKDTLFVTRKIDKYEPYRTMTNKLRPETRELATQVKKLPRCRKEYTALKRELPVEALKNIEVTNKVINFGKVFVHSKIVKQFEIINSNDFSIQAKLIPGHDFLTQSDCQPQIMPAKTRCKFDVVLIPKECGEFESLVEYLINSVHCFKFLVKAEVELVTLTVSKTNLKMNYQDDANDMFLSDSFELTNEGNTSAEFTIEHNPDLFTIEPRTGTLTSRQNIRIVVIYKNENHELMPAGEPKNIKDFYRPSSLIIDERINVKVCNGVDMFLRVQSNIFESKCYVKENKINFGCCIVPKSKSKTFILRNLSRSICLYEIDLSNCHNYLDFDAMKGKVLPESSKEVTVTYKSINIHEVNMSFKVIIRGGPVITVPFHAESIAPQISIQQDQFNFQEVCCGNIGSLPITIRNDSETAVELILDLLNHHAKGSEYLDICFIEKEDKICLSKPQPKPTIHKVKIEARSTCKYTLTFEPKSPGFYEFQLPLYIQNFIKNDMISKTVTCFAKKPKFFLEPAIVKFKKKIINDKDNSCFHPLIEFVTLKNPSENILKWKIEMPKLESGKKLCFEIENRKGEVKQKSWQCINIAFNPYEAGFFVYTFPVMIYSWEKGEYVQEAEVKVEGEGQYPILLFDRRELILPVVPLHVESVGMFKIINEGYEAIDIKHRIYSMEELMLIPQIILFYPQGSKMGINKKQLYVIVKFVAKKPVSFTVKLEIYDGCRIYELPISGTSDNSIFSNFPYLSDKENLYKLEQSVDSVTLRNIDSRNIIDKLHNHYEQISEADYYLPCEIIRRWINTLLRDEKVMRFPEDLVNSNENLLKFLSKLTSKKEIEKLPAEAESQQKFYQGVIRTLKAMGCLLNHIRPYYLLSQPEFRQIFEDPSLRHMASTYHKYYRVIHLECWIILFYQVVSNFWYNPQKMKHMEIKSNVYSSTELQVLKWIKSIYTQYNDQDEQHKFVDFNKDFKDCFAPIYALYHYNYMNKASQSLEGLNRRIVSTTDFLTNVRMLYNMLGKANIIPLVSEDEYQYIKEKEMFMLLFQFYESLPQQIPKNAPIIFPCELGEKCTKFIEIKNPSNKSVNYWVKIEGSQDYYLEEKEFIKIEPKATYKLAVEFRSRVSQEEVAFLTLFNKKELDNNSGVGCSLIFELRSQIIGRKSIKKLETLKCAIYDNTSVKIPVENHFNDKEYGNFKIIIMEEFIENKEPTKMFNFYVEIESIKIRRGTVSNIELFFNPMIMKPIKCLLIFCDASVGQFQYEIIGIPEVPKPLQEIKVPNPIYINTLESIDLNLPVYNNFMIKSQSLMEQKWELLKNTNRLNRTYDVASKLGEDSESEIKFEVEVNMDPKILEYVSIPPNLTLFQKKKTKADIKNRLKIYCNFNIIIKDLTLDFILVSHDKKDVRRFKAQLNVTSQPMVSQLTLKTNARTPLLQEIPIENTTSKDWRVSCVISELEDNQFSLKQDELLLHKEYHCKKDSKIVCYFVYSPVWIGESSCKLTITNIVTNEQIIYEVQGISEEPLSDDHIYFSIFTGKSGLHSIPIKNPYADKLVYRVITDLPEINCSPEVALDPNEKTGFNFIVSVNNPGIFIGYIKFVDKSGRFFWYSITIEAEDQVILEENIKLETMVGKEVEKVLEFKNSLTKTSSYKVDYDSEFLQGERMFDVKPYSSYLYRLKFKPTSVINKETSMRIFCPEKGAHLYKVQMISHEHYKKQLPSLKTEVGRVGFHEIKLIEPELTKNNIKHEVSNPNFSVEFEEPKANNELIVRICYKPVQEGSEHCTVKLSHGFNLTKMYEIQGIGIAPFTIESVEFSTTELKPVLEIIKFKNPYQKAENSKNKNEKFFIMIQSNDLEVYNFVGYPQRWEAQITDVLPIPVQFRPKQEGYYQSMLTVQAEHYKWKYLLKGSSVNEINPFHFDEELCCTTRVEGIKVLRMDVPDFLRDQGLKPNKISINHANPRIIAMIKKWLKLKIEMSDSQEENKTVVYVRFRPKKPIDEIITISLFNQIQESVKVSKKLKLFSEPPAPEQKITIQINSIRKHLFKIPMPVTLIENINECETKFEKGEYFESSIENQNISVSFMPNNCTFKTNSYKDLLIIESEEEYWSFEVEIELVDNLKPKNLKSKK